MKVSRLLADYKRPPAWPMGSQLDRRVAEMPIRRGRLRFVWMGFLVFPILDLFSHEPSTLRLIGALAGLGVFIALAVYTVQTPMGMTPPRGSTLSAAGMVVLAVSLTIADRPSWSVMFPACAAILARQLPDRLLLPNIFVITAVSTLATLGGGSDQAIGIGATTFGVVLMMTALRSLLDTNVELHEARDELARMAVADERTRFARDLHDLLGHSLSVIALKAELAGRLLPSDPEAAAGHVGDVEGVARDALAQVRQAVSGYYQPVLSSELAGARVALEAAGIEPALIEDVADLPTDVEAALAWTVREGTTNVIRHSGARSCRISAVCDERSATLEIDDDGSGAATPAVDDGHGLAGLRARIAGVNGHLDAGSGPNGGFRLRVTVPLGAVA